MERPISHVVLNPVFWERAGGDKTKLKGMIAAYIKVAYPNYVLKAVKKNEHGSYFGICERVK